MSISPYLFALDRLKVFFVIPEENQPDENYWVRLMRRFAIDLTVYANIVHTK